MEHKLHRLRRGSPEMAAGQGWVNRFACRFWSQPRPVDKTDNAEIVQHLPAIGLYWRFKRTQVTKVLMNPILAMVA